MSEVQTTANAYEFPYPNLPRNWKRVDCPAIHPMICGVNSNRELRILQSIQGQSWNPILFTKHVWRNPENRKPIPRQPCYANVQEERRYPKHVFWLYMKHAGPTLQEWVEENQNCPQFFSEFIHVIRRIFVITQELKNLNVIHGDLHAKNICYDDGKLMLIDWGWCMAPQYTMGKQELEYFQQCLREGFDWMHFVSSLEYMYGKRTWWASLQDAVDQFQNVNEEKMDSLEIT